LIGIAQGIKWVTEGRHVTPGEALKLGLVHEVVPTDQVVERARAWLLGRPEAVQPWDRKGFRVPGGAGASDFAISQLFAQEAARLSAQTQHNYPAPIAILSCIYEGTVLPMPRALQIESKYFSRLVTSSVARNLMRTMFINKGLADKLARRPVGVPLSTVRKLGVLGAGMMGSGIAYAGACAGLEAVLLDTSKELAEAGRGYSQGVLETEIQRGRQSPENADAILQRIRPTTRSEDLDGCDLVIEAVFEQREIKARVTQAAEAQLGPNATFASNTSTLPITGLAEASSRPQQFIGLHFFSPVEKMPLVEVIVGKRTSQETVARALDFVRQLRKTPIVVNDSRGFYTSRVFGTFVHEGIRLLEEGVAPALIENAARMAGMPVGPLAVSDEVSIDLLWKVIRQGEEDLGSAYVRPAGYVTVKRFVENLKRLGRRHGAGFYDYPAGGRKHLWSGLRGLYPLSATQPAVEEVKQRLLYIQALESARCLEEGVLVHPADGDIGSILGWGFPSWTGGTLSLIDTVGLADFIAACDRLCGVCGARFQVSDRLRAQAQQRGMIHESRRRPASQIA
jgi:3-hydroxyacyl-CoA dehydrogenase/enoyl-CoA hydratase/3-hydroxybutyryl-CoA epimerase